jgi:CRISPR/Cas system CMR-associated protein Cmr5 small subunit
MHLDQQRARLAFDFVQKLSSQGRVREEFLSLARKLPVMFQTNGLLATWAHLLAKNESAHRNALAAMTEYLAPREPREKDRTADARTLFGRWLRGDAQGGVSALSGGELRERTAEAIEYAVWLKRAAEAFCDTGEAKP